jgi:uncharacterized membrane protein YdjX (TVP38/TMEM64 family)
MDVFLDQEALESFMRGLGFWGPVAFFLLQVLQAIIAPIPGNLLTMAGGVLFGFWLGFLLSYAGNAVGSLIGFSIVRKAGRAAMIKLIGVGRFDKWMEVIGTDSANSRTKILLILVILLPLLPSDFMCLAVGLTSISFRSFLIIVIVCRPWGQFAAALLGASSINMPPVLFFPMIAVMIAVCIAAVRFAPRLEYFALRWTRNLVDRFRRTKNIA